MIKLWFYFAKEKLKANGYCGLSYELLLPFFKQ